MKMQYALVSNERQEAQPNLTGKCQCCKSPVIAKCGDVRIWHWAHKTKLECDSWWEESEWHRAWKGQFPKEWQEIIHKAENNEKHIADVKVDQGYVIELQRSPIKSEERQSREAFYKKMIWVVDGTRRLKDKSKFLEYSMSVNGAAHVRKLRRDFDKCTLLREWSECTSTTFFDFNEDVLWVLLPRGLLPTVEERYVFITRRNLLIALLRASPNEISFEKFLKDLAEVIVNGEKSLHHAKKK